MTVYFIGAGPGDAELITVKGQRLLERCPVVIYAGSLVPPELLAGVASDAEIRDSAPLHLEQIIELMKAAQDRGQDVARLHSGDPSLYGAVGEQMRRLDELGIPFEMVPGVTAVAASAAMLKRELTVPGQDPDGNFHPLCRQDSHAGTRSLAGIGASRGDAGNSLGGGPHPPNRRGFAAPLRPGLPGGRGLPASAGRIRTGSAAPSAISSGACVSAALSVRP